MVFVGTRNGQQYGNDEYHEKPNAINAIQFDSRARMWEQHPNNRSKSELDIE